jgi:hypothetical protein
MAYDQTQGGDEGSWSQESEGYRRRTRLAAPVVCDSGAEQTSRMTSPLSGSGKYTQDWIPAVPAHTQPREAYYPDNGYQQPLLPGRNTVDSSVYRSPTSAVTDLQSVPLAPYAYEPLQSLANQYQCVIEVRLMFGVR